MSGNGCVREADLRALVLGELPGLLAQSVTRHLETCPACEAMARQLDSVTDPFVSLLRQVVPPGAVDGLTATLAGPETTLSPAALSPLSRVAGYQLLEELGRGGMSVVYKARQAHPDREVALKMILAGSYAEPERRARFLAEADAIARLQHPHIVQIYEAGQHEGLPFLALEFMAGGTLAQRLDGRPQPPREAAALLEVLARATDYTHTQGVVHRDLKPANILLTEQSQAKLADFGLAKCADQVLTTTGAILGTPAYMAPEQALGDNRAIGPPADIYALGAILYELLTGRPPFRGATPLETLEQTCSQEPVPPSQLQGKLPRDLSTICLKCLHKEPARRYMTAGELADDLKRFLEGEPIQARPVGVAERAWRWCRRNPGWAAMFVSVAILLLVIAAGSSIGMVQLHGALTESKDNLARATQAESDAQDKLWRSYRDQAHALRLSQRQGQRFESLHAVRKALELPLPAGRSLSELRNEAASALALPDVEVVHEWEAWPPGTIGLGFDRTLETYARADRHGNVSVRRVAGDVEIARLPGSGGPAEVYLSPDGRFLAVHDLGPMRLKVWRLTGSIFEAVHEEAQVTRWGVGFSPDSQRLLCSHHDDSISLLELADRRLTTWPAKGSDTKAFFFRPDSSQVAFRTQVNGRYTFLVCDLPNGTVQARLRDVPQNDGLSWHPEGRLLAVCHSDRRIRLYDTATWQPTLVLEGHKIPGIQCVFTPEGDRLLSRDWRGFLRVWDVQTGRQLFTTMSGDIYNLGPDGRVPVREGNQVQILRLAAGREFRTLPRCPAAGPGAYAIEHTNVVLRPDGRLLAVTTEEGTCSLVDPGSGTELAVIPLKRTIPLQFEASGALLTYGSAGLCHWPVQEDQATGRCRLGPPERLCPSNSFDPHGSSADGRVLAVPNYSRGAMLLRRDRAGSPLVLGPQEDARFCAVSPDGRWVATGNHWNTQGIGAKVWDASTGKLIKDLPMNRGCFVAFSPDGKWLATSGEDCRLWAVGTWEEGPIIGRVGAMFAFAPDGRVVAVGNETGVIRLVETATGREYVRLDAPVQTQFKPIGFTPDGSQLIALGMESQALHVWDLRLIRQQLAALGLDWDQPPYPPRTRPDAKPVRMDVDMGKGL